MSGMAYAFPVLVSGSLLVAVSDFMIINQLLTVEISHLLHNAGTGILALVVPILCAGIAFSVSNRTAIAPALFIGVISNLTDAGMLGATTMGFLVGWGIVQFQKIKVNTYLRHIMPSIIFPLTFGVLIPLIYGLTLAPLFGRANHLLISTVNSFGDFARFVVGAFIGYLMIADFGGPINKSTSMVTNGFYLQGYYPAPVIKMMGGMIAPIGIGLASLFKKDRNALRSIILGSLFITESVIPIYEKDPKAVRIASIVGTMIGTGLVSYFQVSSYAIQGGILVAWLFKTTQGFVIALAVGVASTALIYCFIGNKNRTILPGESFALDEYRVLDN